MIIPVPAPMHGAIIVGQETISYITADSHVTVSTDVLSTSTPSCYAPVDDDGSRYCVTWFIK